MAVQLISSDFKFPFCCSQHLSCLARHPFKGTREWSHFRKLLITCVLDFWFRTSSIGPWSFCLPSRWLLRQLRATCSAAGGTPGLNPVPWRQLKSLWFQCRGFNSQFQWLPTCFWQVCCYSGPPQWISNILENYSRRMSSRKSCMSSRFKARKADTWVMTAKWKDG